MIGGASVDNDIVKNNDPIQLQQMIIFLRAELAKYKNEVKRLRDSDYYSLVLRLERENIELTTQKKELSMELLKLKRDHEKKIKTYYDDIQARENQKKKQLSSIEGLLKELEELRAENKLIKESLKFTKDELLSMDGLENKLNVFTSDINQQMKTIIEAIERSRLEQANSDNLNKHLAKVIEGKSSEIEKLSEELASVKKYSFSFSGKTMMNSEILTHLDARVNKVLSQSIDFEKQLNHKLRLLEDLDHKLNELTIEINTDKTV
jgi:chromosome segregation ATPase